MAGPLGNASAGLVASSCNSLGVRVLPTVRPVRSPIVSQIWAAILSEMKPTSYHSVTREAHYA
jgi:hypothetical protein